MNQVYTPKTTYMRSQCACFADFCVLVLQKRFETHLSLTKIPLTQTKIPLPSSLNSCPQPPPTTVGVAAAATYTSAWNGCQGKGGLGRRVESEERWDREVAFLAEGRNV